MQNRSRRFAIAALLAQAAIFAPEVARATVPQGLTEQGRLFDNTGNPLNANVSLTFSIYAAASGGTAVWTETQGSVTLDQGYFSVELGSVSPIPQSIWTGATLYVGVAVNADPEMTPRQPTYSVPYALVSNDAVGAIHPATVSVNGQLVINANGDWVGPSSGLVGPTGPQGAAGAVGATGAAGASGPVGPSGAAGAQGATGATGQQGTAGPQGPIGPVGPTGGQGATGAQGNPGADGATGATGPSGADGGAGATGATGPQGAAGPAGPTGTSGGSGATGPMGPQGATGPAGAAGAQGAAGSNGANGAPGAAGSDGAQGATGPAGSSGAQGATGVQGPTGATGPQGAVGATGPAGSPETAAQIISLLTAAGGLPSSAMATTTRAVMIGGGEFVNSGNTNLPINFSVGTVRWQAQGFTLPKTSTNVATASFVVPSDYVAGQAAPSLTVYWGTDESNSTRQVDCDVSVSRITDIIGPTTQVAFCYNFRQGGSGQSNAMESLNPNQSQIVAQTMPSGNTYDPACALVSGAGPQPGDFMLISIGRNGTSGSDTSGGNMYVYGIAFNYVSQN